MVAAYPLLRPQERVKAKGAKFPPPVGPREIKVTLAKVHLQQAKGKEKAPEVLSVVYAGIRDGILTIRTMYAPDIKGRGITHREVSGNREHPLKIIDSPLVQFRWPKAAIPRKKHQIPIHRTSPWPVLLNVPVFPRISFNSAANMQNGLSIPPIPTCLSISG